MQTYLLPTSTCDKLDKLTRNFWWGNVEKEKRNLHLRAWNAICKSKEAGGLGFRKTRDKNVAFISKLGWQIYKCPKKTWVKLPKSKYLRGTKFLDTDYIPSKGSWIWNSISLLNGACYQVKANSILTFGRRIDTRLPKF